MGLELVISKKQIQNLITWATPLRICYYTIVLLGNYLVYFCSIFRAWILFGIQLLIFIPNMKFYYVSWIVQFKEEAKGEKKLLESMRPTPDWPHLLASQPMSGKMLISWILSTNFLIFFLREKLNTLWWSSRERKPNQGRLQRSENTSSLQLTSKMSLSSLLPSPFNYFALNYLWSTEPVPFLK